MSKIPRKHHYVPQAFLKRFSMDGKRIFVLRKNNTNDKITVNTANIEDVCAERDFYARFNENFKKDIRIEEQYSLLESKLANNVLRQIPPKLLYPYFDGGIILDSKQKDQLADTILMQITRNKSTRNYGMSVANEIYNEYLIERMNSPSSSEQEKSEAEHMLKNREYILHNTIVEGAFLPLVHGNENNLLRNNIHGRNCIILINNTGLDLITSDEPILVGDGLGLIYNIFDYPLGNTDSQIIYVLDSKHVAIMPTKDYFNDCYCDKGVTAFLNPCDVDTIERINNAHFNLSTNFIVSEKKETLLGLIEPRNY